MVNQNTVRELRNLAASINKTIAMFQRCVVRIDELIERVESGDEEGAKDAAYMLVEETSEGWASLGVLKNPFLTRPEGST